jgi:hypothetical protein
MPHMRRRLVTALAGLATLALVGLAAGPARAAASPAVACGAAHSQYVGAAFTGTLTYAGSDSMPLTVTFRDTPNDVETALYNGAAYDGYGKSTLLAGGGVDWYAEGLTAVGAWFYHYDLHTTSAACRGAAVSHLSGTFTARDYFGYVGSGTFDISR